MNKSIKTYLLLCSDIILINLAYFAAFYLRFDGNIIPKEIHVFWQNAFYITAIKIAVFYFFNLYKNLWRYASVNELIKIAFAAIVSNAVVISFLLFKGNQLPRTVYIMVTILDMMFIGGIRFSSRAFRQMKGKDILSIGKNKEVKRLMIIGGGDAGAMVIRELLNHNQLNSKPVAIIDDDPTKKNSIIYGVPVLGTRDDIVNVAEKKNVDEIIIAIPSANRNEIRQIVEESKKTRCKLKILPGMYELIDGKVNVSKIREVEIEDLLGREPVKLNIDEICDYLRGKKVLVTGGGGSIGSELCRQIVKFNPAELIILDIYENNAYDIQNELKPILDKDIKLKTIIASVRDRECIDRIFNENRPDVVFHAAAHKHVPLMEDSPREAIKNNVFGTLNVAQAADKYGVKRFVMISTDKAVNPTNVMGASKRMCEMIIQSMDTVSKTEFVAVRFGNVLGSNGSVIPLFKKQIAKGGPVTITHEEIIRYFMTIPEAAQLVIEAGAMAKGGEIFILDMGEPVKIIDLAKDLIRLSGFEPYEDIPIEVVGLRPGEKLFEELLLAEEGLKSTKHEKIYVGKPLFTDYKLLIKSIDNLKENLNKYTIDELKDCIEDMVPTYIRNNEDINGKFQGKVCGAKDEVASAKFE